MEENPFALYDIISNFIDNNNCSIKIRMMSINVKMMFKNQIDDIDLFSIIE